MNDPRFLNVAEAFRKFATLFERPEMIDQLKERVHVAGIPNTPEAAVSADPGFLRLKRIMMAVELYAQECFGVDWAGKQVSFHKFAELFERKDAMDKLVLRGKDPRGLLLMRLMVLINSYARDVFGEDLQLLSGGKT